MSFRHQARKSLTIAGKNLDELYVTTAKTGYNGEILPERYNGGDLFVVKDLGYSGVERSRFTGNLKL